ncbi:hypothetical protein F0562_034276 [Nyssa sinensis]|uniref:Protein DETOXIFICATION n=1 Tax=Nyssa sinensis TaxID=561372 RepID=A0A5J5AHA9_9ASTE|nr:hypothetical protein F0562_034276 [Nyssa sinensis]
MVYQDAERESGDERVFYRDGGKFHSSDLASEELRNATKGILANRWAGHPRTAKFSVAVVAVTSFIFGILLALIQIFTLKQYPALFSSSTEVKQLAYQLTPMLALSIVINNVQPALSGVGIGAGWQATVAYVNISCYYLFGIPLGLVAGYKLNMGVKISEI